MSIDWAPFADWVKKHQRFLLTTHVRPDGDGLGSMLALGEALQQQGKQATMLSLSLFPPRYAFLDPQQRIQRFVPPGDPWKDADAVIVLDTGTWNQLDEFGPFLKKHSAAKAVIDHHLTQDDLGALQLIDTTAEATGRLSYEAIQAIGGEITEQSANALFVAVAMDTGWFRFNNTRANTFELMANLVAKGAKPEVLYNQLYEQNSLSRYKLMGLILERMQIVAGGKVGYSEIRVNDYQATGAVPQETEDLVNFTRSLQGVEVGLLFMEQLRGGVKVSFRSRSEIDVGKVAEQFGGGGHRLASGAIVEAPLKEVQQRVLQAVQEVLK